MPYFHILQIEGLDSSIGTLAVENNNKENPKTQEPAGSKDTKSSDSPEGTPSNQPSNPSSPSPSPHTSNPTEPVDSESQKNTQKSGENSKPEDKNETQENSQGNDNSPELKNHSKDEKTSNDETKKEESSKTTESKDTEDTKTETADNKDTHTTPNTSNNTTKDKDTQATIKPETDSTETPSKPQLVPSYHVRFDSAIVEPFINAPKNMRAYKLYNFNQLFHCLFNGHLLLNPQLFQHNQIQTPAGSNSPKNPDDLNNSPTNPTDKIQPIDFNTINTDLLKNLPDALTLRLHATTPHCPISIKAKLQLDTSTGTIKSLSFIALVAIISLFLIKGGYQMVLEIMNNLHYTHRLSMPTLMILNFQDFGLIMFFLIKGFRNQLFLNYYLFLFFLYMFITTFFSMRIMLFTWRIKNGFVNINQTLTAEFRKKFFLFQLKFYFLLIAYFLLMDMLLEFHPLLVLASSFILIPQIFTNLGQQLHRFDRCYILYFAFPRFLIFFYMRVTAFNVEDIRPYPFTSGLALAVLLLSMVVIYFQAHYGSFFFLPRCLRWKQYNYFIRLKDLKQSLLSKDFSNRYELF